MRKPTRREILKLGGGALLGWGAAEMLASCGETKAKAPQPAPQICNAVSAEPLARVAAVRGSDLRAMTFAALEAIGGMGTVVHPGETVFIKPNLVTLPWASPSFDPFRAGECTKPEILIAAAEACLEAGASQVTIGDGSQASVFDWARARTLDGSTNLPSEAARLSASYGRPVTLACLDSATSAWLEVPTAGSLGTLAVSSLVVNADRVISIPVAKTHQWAYLTLSIKNFIGITPLARYGCDIAGGHASRYLIHADRGPAGFGRLSIDLARAAHPDLAIIDFSYGIEGNGPTLGDGGSTFDVASRLGSWLVLASTDLVAADATAARVMGQELPYVDEVLSMAAAAGMGVPCQQSIALAGERLEDIRFDCTPAVVS